MGEEEGKGKNMGVLWEAESTLSPCLESFKGWEFRGGLRGES